MLVEEEKDCLNVFFVHQTDFVTAKNVFVSMSTVQFVLTAKGFLQDDSDSFWSKEATTKQRSASTSFV